MLANVYLHEFDFFVRHALKPLGYTRYGDDFIVIVGTRQEALRLQSLGSSFLKEQLRLELHSKNNIVVKVKYGVKYLGVITYPKRQTLSSQEFKRIQDKLLPENCESYNSYIERYGSTRQKDALTSQISRLF